MARTLASIPTPVDPARPASLHSPLTSTTALSALAVLLCFACGSDGGTAATNDTLVPTSPGAPGLPGAADDSGLPATAPTAGATLPGATTPATDGVNPGSNPTAAPTATTPTATSPTTATPPAPTDGAPGTSAPTAPPANATDPANPTDPGVGNPPATDPGNTATDMTELDRVIGWLTNTLAVGALPNYAYDNIETNFADPTEFNRLATAVVEACTAFAPSAIGVQYCEAIIVSAMVAESSYNPLLIVEDAYGGAADPTVGLLQNRFSSTVHDYNFYGPLDVMARIGCTWPSNLPAAMDAPEWRTLGGTSVGLDIMQDPACSVGLATWYYMYNATCNGGASGDPVYIFQCCSGQGVGGTIEIGLLSHLRGPDPANPPGPLDAYVQGIECCAGGSPNDTPCNGCTGRFAAMIGGLPNPDPFFIPLVPEPAKYCAAP